MAFRFKKLDIPEIIYIKPDIYPDQRGFFCEVYKYPEFAANGITKPFVQVNHSKSSKNTLRGLHYQKNPKAQGKLVTVIEGEIFDAVVDVRKGSPAYGKWVGQTLNADKKDMIYVPEGFAHGFCAISESAQVMYFSTELYSPKDERGVVYNDPKINISWPVKAPVLSDKDRGLPLLKEADNNFRY
ncbi:MAG: dTDP-4-dehydrorhamnose 3,5-epimerase [Candidatus Omnitrophica bacterium]|nr:dTDP-4-dehydrorhamnose 3,5-epimerase [Candidatus Omnitrophota bacterium]